MSYDLCQGRTVVAGTRRMMPTMRCRTADDLAVIITGLLDELDAAHAEIQRMANSPAYAGGGRRVGGC